MMRRERISSRCRESLVALRAKMWRDARSFMVTEAPVEVIRMVLAREILRGV